MLNKSKTISASGSSVIKVGGADVVVMTMSASVSENGSANVSKYIQDKDIYLQNKSAADADYAEFETYAESLMEV